MKGSHVSSSEGCSLGGYTHSTSTDRSASPEAAIFDGPSGTCRSSAPESAAFKGSAASGTFSAS